MAYLVETPACRQAGQARQAWNSPRYIGAHFIISFLSSSANIDFEFANSKNAGERILLLPSRDTDLSQVRENKP
jgi:hypothetical protein